MGKCIICGLEHSGRSEFCSRSCYYKDYYNKNKKTINERRKEWHKKNYVYHPLPTLTQEEKKEYRKKYYEEHKEYYKNKNREWYLKHKDEEEYKNRVRKNLRAAYYRRKERSRGWKK